MLPICSYSEYFDGNKCVRCTDVNFFPVKLLDGVCSPCSDYSISETRFVFICMYSDTSLGFKDGADSKFELDVDEYIAEPEDSEPEDSLQEEQPQVEQP